MKLYTEEVLRNSMNSVKYYMEHYDASTIDSIIEKHIKALGSIELPSDEEVHGAFDKFYQKSNDEFGLRYAYMGAFEDGAKWIIEQIKQQNNGK